MSQRIVRTARTDRGPCESCRNLIVPDEDYIDVLMPPNARFPANFTLYGKSYRKCAVHTGCYTPWRQKEFV